MKEMLKEMWRWGIYSKAGQMCAVGCFLMGLGFGFWHALGFIGLVLYFRCWEE